MGLREYGPVMGVVGKALGILFAICVAVRILWRREHVPGLIQTVAAVLNTPSLLKDILVKVIIGFDDDGHRWCCYSGWH